MQGCLGLIVLIFISWVFGSVARAIFGCSLETGAFIGLGIIGIIGLFLNINNATPEDINNATPEDPIEKRKREHTEKLQRIRKNSRICPLCKSTTISTSWVDTWKIGKAGRKNVYMCNTCGKNWQLNSKGNIGWF